MSRTSPLLSTLLLLAAATASTAPAQDYGSRGNLGATATAAERAEMEALYERFVPYIDKARTELTMVRETVAYAEARGFREWDPAIREVHPGEQAARGRHGPRSLRRLRALRVVAGSRVSQKGSALHATTTFSSL